MRSKETILLIVKVVFALILFLACPVIGLEASITIAWTPPATNADSTPCTDLAGYKVYYDTENYGFPYNGIGLDQGDSPIIVPVSSLPDPSNPLLILSGLTSEATYYFTITAYDENLNESDYSNEFSAIAPDEIPPAVAITVPTSSNSYSTTLSSITLIGYSSDDIGVTNVTWSDNHGNSGAASGTTNWSLNSIPLVPGDTTIIIAAEDSSGNRGTAMITVTYTDPMSIDSENDGIPDPIETMYGLNPLSADSDGDGITDLTEFGPFELPLDSDGDGIIDALDLDADNDGISDFNESTLDADNDGTPNYRDSNDTDGPSGDQDADGISNINEATYGLNPNLADSDQDGFSDQEEWGTSNLPADSDNDGIIDALDLDSDNDGALDQSEGITDKDGDGIPDRLDPDTATLLTSHGSISILVQEAPARLEEVTFLSQTSTDGLLPNRDFRYGGVQFKVNGIDFGANVTIQIQTSFSLPSNVELWKYSTENGYYNIPTTISGNTIQYTLTDGATGDEDQLVNGMIMDPVYIGIPVTSDNTVGTPTGGDSGSSGTSGSSDSGGGGGCSLSKNSGNVPDIFSLLSPLILAFVLKRRKTLSIRGKV